MGRELFEDIAERRFAAPAVRRPGQRVVDRLFTPLDARERILVFAFHAEHVAEFVQRGAAAVRRGEIPAVHGRRFVQRHRQDVASDRRGRTAVRLGVTDPYFRFREVRDFLEIQADAEALPGREGGAHRIRLLLRYGEVTGAEKTVMQHRAVHPFRPHSDDGGGPTRVGGHARMQLRYGPRHIPAKRLHAFFRLVDFLFRFFFARVMEMFPCRIDGCTSRRIATGASIQRIAPASAAEVLW
jgi:hypothetical protein